MADFIKRLTRTKPFPKNVLDTRLRRDLFLLHIVFLGIGHMVGGGLYVFTGRVMQKTGPAIIFSYLLAGISALLSTLSFAEMESRLPMAGSAYTYAYFVISESVAFLIGWSMILRSVVSVVILAKAWSSTFDVLLNNRITHFTKHHIGPVHDFTSTGYFENENGPDLVAAVIVIIGSLLICFGAQRSANFITFFSCLNITVIIFIISLGLTLSNVTFWTDVSYCNSTLVSNDSGKVAYSITNAFMPNGFLSVISGAASIYYAYAGFDAIGSSGEETKSPQTNLPFGTLGAVCIVIIAYLLMSITLSLLVPYCTVSSTVPFQHAFRDRFIENGIPGIKYVEMIIYVGHLSSITTVLFGKLFYLTRTIYAMSLDGMIFSCFKKLHPKTFVPVSAVIVFGLITAVMALFCNFGKFIYLSALATLLSCIVVAICLIILRYNPNSHMFGGKMITTGFISTYNTTGTLKLNFRRVEWLLKVFRKKTVPWMTFILSVLYLIIGTIITWTKLWSWWNILLLVFFSCLILLCTLIIYAHEPSAATLYFKV